VLRLEGLLGAKRSYKGVMSRILKAKPRRRVRYHYGTVSACHVVAGHVAATLVSSMRACRCGLDSAGKLVLLFLYLSTRGVSATRVYRGQCDESASDTDTSQYDAHSKSEKARRSQPRHDYCTASALQLSMLGGRALFYLSGHRPSLLCLLCDILPLTAGAEPAPRWTR
jgi:hypothetical protein